MINIHQPRRNCCKNFSTSLVGTICCKKTYDQYIFLFISILFLKINQCIMIFYEHFFFYRGIKDLSGLRSLSTSWYWGVASWSSRCKRLFIFYFLRERVAAFFLGGGEGGSHGFQGERREDQSSPTECKGKSMKKLTANTLPMGGGENIAEP